MKIRAIFAFLILVCACCPAGAQTAAPAQPQPQAAAPSQVTTIDPQKAADIRRLMEITGAADLGTQLMHSMQGDIRPTIENSLPPGEYRAKLVDLFLERFQSKANGGALVVLLIPIYDKHFSDDEIKQLTAFYLTPVGKKAVAELPKVVTESQQVGREWGETVGRDSMMEVLSEHPDLKKALEDAQRNNFYPSAQQ